MKTLNKIKFIVILFFSFSFNYSQTLESITKTDTVYIFFNHIEFQQEKMADINRKKTLKEVRNYEIKFDEKNFINFSERKYLDFDSIEFDKQMDKKTVKKSFLKKNKNIIIDINFIKKYGLKEVYFLIQNKKKYLIDSKEIKYKKLILKEVTFGNVSYTPTE